MPFILISDQMKRKIQKLETETLGNSNQRKYESTRKQYDLKMYFVKTKYNFQQIPQVE